MFEGTPLIKKIFWINVLAFSLTLILASIDFSVFEYFAQWSYKGDNFYPWQLITHQFLHAGFIHIIFNMLALLSIGPFVEKFLGEKKFVPFYLLCGIGSALLHMSLTNSVNIPMVGASGALYGLLVLFSIIHPDEKLYLFLIPIGIKSKYMVGALIVIEVLLGIFSTSDGVGHWAHIGGALTGFLLYLINKKYLRNIY
jgi:membrane associated rhomboid family serine protease